MTARLREFLARLAGSFRPDRAESGLHDEIREHLRLMQEDYVRRGMTPDEAARAARIAFGNVALARELHRDQRRLPGVESIWQDLRYAWRLFRRSRGFALTAVLTLALGIGLNTTLFTALNAVAFRPLPVRDGDRLVRIERWFASHGLGDIQWAFSEPEFRYLAAQDLALADLIAAGWPYRVQDASGERPHVQVVSPNYFAVLGVVPAVGGVFAAGGGSDAGVVLSHAFWTRRYAGDPRIAGRVITLNGAAFTILGVTPPSFVGTANPPQVPDVWAPMAAESRMAGARSMARRFQILGHVRPETTVRAAEARVSALVQPLAAAFRADDPTTALTLQRATYFGETNDPRFAAFVTAVMAVVALILLIACANIANMLLARAAGRRREIGMRLALGASRARIVRQLLTESVLLAVVGGAAGLALSTWAARALWLLIAEPVRLFAHGDVAPLVDLAPDARIFGFTFVVSLLAAAAFGLTPALRVSRPDVMAALRDEASLFGRRIPDATLRRWFVGGQMAASMALLLAAGLLLRGLAASRGVSTGYDPSRVFDVQVNRGGDARLQAQIAESLSRAPGLSVALADRLPLEGTWTPPMTADGPAGRINARTLANRVSPEYFATLGVPLVRGRVFRGDELRGPGVAVVSENAARLFWPGQDPLGRSFTLDMNFRRALQTFEVIGVARDVRTANLSRLDPSYVYLPLEPSGHDHVIVRASMAPRDAAAAVRATIGATAPGLLAGLQVTSLEEGPLRLWKSMTGTLAGFAGTLAVIALGLAMGGIYGVAGYLASARRHEIGVRMALGARRADVFSLVLTDALGPVVAGAGSGLVVALGISALMRASLSFPATPDVLFGVSAFDLGTFGGVTALLTLVTLAASAGPLWRATRVDPVDVLRQT